MNKLLTEDHWKKTGLPLRSAKEKQTQKKTGISEALRSLEAADKALRLDILNAALVKKVKGAQDTLTKALQNLKAEDPALATLKSNMLKAMAERRNEHNQLVSAVKAEVLGSIPGGLKAIRDHGARELSTENQKFLETIVKIADQPDKVLAYMRKALQEINIGNSTALWQTLLQQRQAWEQAVGADVRKTITDVQLTQQDSLMRLKYGCKL